MRGLTKAVAVAVLVGALVGCRHKPEQAAPVEPADSSAPIPEPPPGAGLAGVNLPLSQLLGSERLSRPTGTPRTEQVFAALEVAGLALTGRTQVLGRTIGASFCEIAHTSVGVVFSVCEFKDGPSAEAGREYSSRAFGKALPDRVLLINKKTLLTITPARAPAAEGDAKKGAAAFERLSG
ncbi:MAG TPA: hypothetical protein VI139_05735 [Gemmatimonadales bacterium]